jgi:hypothetical protein
MSCWTFPSRFPRLFYKTKLSHFHEESPEMLAIAGAPPVYQFLDGAHIVGKTPAPFRA